MPLLLSSLPDQVMPPFRVEACAVTASQMAAGLLQHQLAPQKGGIAKSGKLDSSMTIVKLLLAAVCLQYEWTVARRCEVAVPEGEGSALRSSTAYSPGRTGTPQSLLPHSPHCAPVLVHKPPSSVADLGMPEGKQ